MRNETDVTGLDETVSRRNPRLWPLTVASAVGLAILIGLGVWQLQRKVWKEDLIDRLASRTSAAPVSLDVAVDRFRRGGDIEYMRVTFRGRFLHDKERYFYAPDPMLGPGYEVYTPLELIDDGRIVFVNRGFVPDRLKDRERRREGLTAGGIDVTGPVRSAETPGLFTPENDRAGNLWYWRDLNAMRTSAFGNTERAYVPFFVESETAASGGWPKGKATRVSLPNRHFGYALTWFGIAATLLGVYLALLWSRLRNDGDKRPLD